MKKGITFALALAAVALGAPATSRASDHVDGLKTGLDSAADLTDVFTFVSPKDSNKLVLIMNVHGFASSGTKFSNAVDYKFRIRPIEDEKKLVPSADPAKEQTIVCTFSSIFLTSRQHATCALNLHDGTETVTFDTRGDDFKAGGQGVGQGIRVFAGVRSDPWFLDLGKVLKFNGGTTPVPNASGSNGLHGTNVLSIVVEVDKARLGGPLLAVTAQTVRK